jgi:hypothetical protein
MVPRNDASQGAHAFETVEGNTTVSAIASTRATRRGLRTWHVRTLLVREPGDLQLDRRRLAQVGGPHWEGEEAQANDARAGEGRPRQSSDEACEQCCAGGGGLGAGGAQ